MSLEFTDTFGDGFGVVGTFVPAESAFKDLELLRFDPDGELDEVVPAIPS
jgi:hypothetical protein